MSGAGSSPEQDAAPLSTEAGVYEWPRLTADQQSAVTRILTHLSRAADAPQDPARRGDNRCALPYLPRIDRHRANSILLIDGDRGTGKTSVLLTLLDVLLGRFCEHVCPPARPAAAPASAALPRPVACVVPLNSVDLQALPDETHVLLHVLSKLESLLTALEPQEPSAPAWARVGGLSDCKDARQRWTHLKKVAILGWPTSASGSTARVDPETRIFESHDAEEARLSLPEAFASFVDVLLADLKRTWRLEREPLLVLPIDDADMNPHLSVALLHLLRLLYHPRVRFLVTGHSEQFLKLLRLDMQARAFRPLAGAMPASVQSDEYWKDAQRLAAQWYLKAVPRDSRALLPSLSVQDRLSVFERLMQGQGNPAVALEPLAPVPGASAGEVTLYHYLHGLDVVKEALPDHLRGLVALAQRIGQDVHGDRARAKDAVLAMWEDACQRAATPLPRDVEDEAVQGRSEEGRLVLHVDGSAFRLKAQQAFWCRGLLERPPSPPHQGVPTVALAVIPESPPFVPEDMQIACYLATSPHLILANEPLGARRSGAFLLAAWVALDDDDDRVSGVDARFEPFVEVSLPTTGRSARLEFAWPLPRWQWPDVLLFAQGWYTRVRALPYGDPRPTPEMAALFLDLVVRVALGRDVGGAPRASHAIPGPVDLAARVLPLNLTNSVAPRDERFEIHRHWLRECALLFAAPESGLPAYWASGWAAALRSGLERTPGAFDEWVEASRNQRAERAARALVATGAAGVPGDEAIKRLLHDLDTSFFSWEKLVVAA